MNFIGLIKASKVYLIFSFKTEAFRKCADNVVFS